MTLIDVLHNLMEQETAQMLDLCPNNKTKAGKRDAMIYMRKLSKRDAYYRVIHILRGYDSEFKSEESCLLAIREAQVFSSRLQEKGDT